MRPSGSDRRAQAAELHVRGARCELLNGNLTAAMAAVRAALTAGVCSADELNLLASIAFHCGQHHEAMTLYQRAFALEPANIETLHGLALIHRALGQLEDADLAANRLLERDPRDYEVLHVRSSLRRQSTESNHIDQLKQILRADRPAWRDAVKVGYALAKELEDVGRYEESFDFLSQAATLKHSHTQYDVRQDLDTLKTIRLALDGKVVDTRRGSGHSSVAPIFVLGLPRTGSTLLERIISSHPDVRSAGELNGFALAIVKLTTSANGGSPVPKGQLASVATRLDMQELGHAYIDATRHFARDTPRFIDKNPMNALNVGLIHLALPKAKIVWVERAPMDHCYAMYKFLFNGAYPFSYDLEELGSYYLAHQELMRHWISVLPPGAICRLQYEDLVENTQCESRRVIQELGLEWDEACLHFVDNKAAATTGSASQVRLPVYRSSVALWQRYERQLAPLLRILQGGGIAVGSGRS